MHVVMHFFHARLMHEFNKVWWRVLCFTISRCPVPKSAFVLLRTNTERISMTFGGGNHYHQQINWLHFGQNFTTDKGAHDTTENLNWYQTSAAV